MALAGVLAPVGKIIDTQNRKTESIIATAGQTVFTLVAAAYVPAMDTLDVYVNGIRKDNITDYIESSATTVTFITPLLAGQKVSFVSNVVVNNGNIATNASATASASAANALVSANNAKASEINAATAEANIIANATASATSAVATSSAAAASSATQAQQSASAANQSAIDAANAASSIPSGVTLPTDLGFVYDQVIGQVIDLGVV